MAANGLDLVPEAVVVLDEQRRVVDVNDRAAMVLGLDEQVRGRQLDEVLQLETEEGTPCPAPVPPRGTSHRIAERVWFVARGDGGRRRVAMAGRWLDDGGVTLTFRSLGRTAVERRGDGELVAAVSHELRTPLATVRGFARDLLAGWERHSDERRRASLEAIAADAERVGRLLEDLLTAARLGARRTTLAIAPIDLGTVAERVVAAAGARHPGAADRLGLTVEDGLPRVPADGDRIEQVLTNLVENALVHAGEAHVDVTLATAGDEVTAVVRDDGAGVPEDRRAQVFERFRQGDEQSRSGAGLGLYISRGLARAHGGALLLHETPGGGATFTLRLPLPRDPTTRERP